MLLIEQRDLTLLNLDGPVRVEVVAAQAVEHYEMTRYGTLRTWAEELGYTKSVKLLQQTLDEERATDAALTKLRNPLLIWTPRKTKQHDGLKRRPDQMGRRYAIRRRN